jgi:hypothetical protein
MGSSNSSNSSSSNTGGSGLDDLVVLPKASAPAAQQQKQQKQQKQKKQHQQHQQLQRASTSTSGSGNNRTYVPQQWHRPEDDTTTRDTVVQQIIGLLQARRPTATSDWSYKLPHVAKRLENELYHAAETLEEYTDTQTLKNRLQQLAVTWSCVGMPGQRPQHAGTEDSVRHAATASAAAAPSTLAAVSVDDTPTSSAAAFVPSWGRGGARGQTQGKASGASDVADFAGRGGGAAATSKRGHGHSCEPASAAGERAVRPRLESPIERVAQRTSDGTLVAMHASMTAAAESLAWDGSAEAIASNYRNLQVTPASVHLMSLYLRSLISPLPHCSTPSRTTTDATCLSAGRRSWTPPHLQRRRRPWCHRRRHRRCPRSCFGLPLPCPRP